MLGLQKLPSFLAPFMIEYLQVLHSNMWKHNTIQHLHSIATKPMVQVFHNLLQTHVNMVSFIWLIFIAIARKPGLLVEKFSVYSLSRLKNGCYAPKFSPNISRTTSGNLGRDEDIS